MTIFNSEWLADRIAQLQNGLISESEFIECVQMSGEAKTKLLKFNQLVYYDCSYTLDDFQIMKDKL